MSQPTTTNTSRAACRKQAEDRAHFRIVVVPGDDPRNGVQPDSLGAQEPQRFVLAKTSGSLVRLVVCSDLALPSPPTPSRLRADPMLSPGAFRNGGALRQAMPSLRPLEALTIRDMPCFGQGTCVPCPPI